MQIPAPVIEEHEGFVVVRDDLLSGGTKLRGAGALFKAMPDINEYVYGGGPAYGYAQIALAEACKHYGKRFTMFLARRKTLHPYTQRAVDAGCNLIEVPMGMLTVTKCRAREYAAERGDCAEVPFGLNHPAVIDAIADAARMIDYYPQEVWSVGASGTLTRALQKAWPWAKFFVVQVGHKMAPEEYGAATVVECDLPFSKSAKQEDMPPFPSVPNYDAKAFKYLRMIGAKGALFWNVAA